MADYESAGGSLKFKGGGGITKKKKKKTDASKVKAALEAKEATPPPSKPIKVLEKTAAELKFEEVQRKRQEEKVLKSAMKSHKEKVAELNRKLEEMTEHYDIPKVGPG
ncbi:hypothetical protein BGZ80_004700 [Entomortierella chlamydospora]|uniref:DUF1754-domain-containing protein n=1 Tax=Entomortierella chlamydospora TaxID=101097 RepID=A0A9P6T2I6_9FUNG|nr:hypothetical protein BGX26_006811 [Mortierella sp. AD094]KAF9997347.1 hypothetical protein BGZ79_008957 [Entomortierella chlamydospora]KAG0020149.1 hypothetical protein BGZ80_004700 [Entomortierella chlamydospora]